MRHGAADDAHPTRGDVGSRCGRQPQDLTAGGPRLPRAACMNGDAHTTRSRSGMMSLAQLCVYLVDVQARRFSHVQEHVPGAKPAISRVFCVELRYCRRVVRVLFMGPVRRPVAGRRDRSLFRPSDARTVPAERQAPTHVPCTPKVPGPKAAHKRFLRLWTPREPEVTK